MKSNIEFYEAFASTYETYYKDVDAHKTVRQCTALLEAKKLILPPHTRSKSPPFLLDIGCGPGWHLRPWQNANFNVSGLDSSPSMLRLAAKNADAGFNKNITLYCANILQQDCLRLLAGRFDLAVSHFNFLNLFSIKQLDQVFSTCSLILSSDGLWITDVTVLHDVPANELPFRSSDKTLGWRRTAIPRHDTVRVEWERHGQYFEENYWFHSRDQLARAAVGAGFRLVGSTPWKHTTSADPAKNSLSLSHLLLIFTCNHHSLQASP